MRERETKAGSFFFLFLTVCVLFLVSFPPRETNNGVYVLPDDAHLMIGGESGRKGHEHKDFITSARVLCHVSFLP